MPDVTLSDICSEHRRRYPERLAVIDGAKRLTWPQFDDRVIRAARCWRNTASYAATGCCGWRRHRPGSSS